MRKFKLTDEHLVDKIYDHLKSFDKLDKLSITVKEIAIAEVVLTIKIDEEFEKSMKFPHRDGVLLITETIEDLVKSLSRQVTFFEDIEDLTGLKISRKTYRSERGDLFAMAETVIDGVKFEFSFAPDLSEKRYRECHIEINLDSVIDGLRHESRISTGGWFDYDGLEQTWSKFKNIVDQNKEN
jgi:hypothetical protein